MEYILPVYILSASETKEITAMLIQGIQNNYKSSFQYTYLKYRCFGRKHVINLINILETYDTNEIQNKTVKLNVKIKKDIDSTKTARTVSMASLCSGN
jgi:hypothetical protein